VAILANRVLAGSIFSPVSSAASVITPECEFIELANSGNVIAIIEPDATVSTSTG
jgi:hypothetical protein